MRLATRSILRSLSKSRPYPDLISNVVTPSSRSARARGTDCLKSSSSLAARVANTLEAMPPPLRAISS